MAERMRKVELEQELVKTYANTFISRWDMYPIQLRNGTYVAVKKPLRLGLVYAHLTCCWKEARPFTLGAYALSKESTARWLCLDADDRPEWEQVWTLACDLKKKGIPTYAEQSRRGGHLWFFFQSPIPGDTAKAFGEYLLKAHDIPAGLEIYPKQTKLGDGPGSLVRLPLGIHQKSGQVYHFAGLNGKPLAATITDQIRLLANPKRVPQAFVEKTLLRAQQDQEAESPTPEIEPLSRASLQSGETLSEAIKRSITVYDLVSRYVELDNRNRGHCPFHDDKHKSFGVNRQKNYWHCWAGCGGGSVIDFYAKWREIHGQDGSFTTTVLVLREMLLG
jgi:hypothetical protein